MNRRSAGCTWRSAHANAHTNFIRRRRSSRVSCFSTGASLPWVPRAPGRTFPGLLLGLDVVPEGAFGLARGVFAAARVVEDERPAARQVEARPGSDAGMRGVAEA